MGIECDGATYHSARSARDRDKLRQRVLEARGWKIHRIWSHDWWQDKDAEIARLVAAIEQEKVAAAPPAAPAPAQLIEEVPRAESPSGTRPYAVAPEPEAITTELELTQYLARIVAYEGPIEHDLLIIRLRDATGSGRLGANLKAVFENMIRSAVAGKRILQDGDAYYSDMTQIRTPRDWSGRAASERKIAYVPIPEVRAALTSVVASNFGIPVDVAIKGAFSLLGFKRQTDEASERGRRAADDLLESGEIVLRDDLLFLAQVKTT
jgi:hypothetical protein